MIRPWKFIFLFLIATLLLVGCSASLDEKTSNGIKAASEAFHAEQKDATDDIEGITLYKPAGFTINEKSDSQNIIMKRNADTYILFINSKEKENSRLFYDLLSADQNKKIIAEETFTDDGIFGFAAVIQSDNDKVELITSIGGVKMTTLAKESKIDQELPRMMDVVRSISQNSESNGAK